MSAGVYAVKCLKNGRRYVGSSGISIDSRFSWHLAMLRAGKHPIEALQQDWDKWGEENFSMVVLALCANKAEAIAEEQRQLDKRGRLYNVASYADSARGTKRNLLVKASMSMKAKERNARPEYRVMISERAKAQHAAGTLGRAAWSNKVEREVLDKLRERAPQVSKQMSNMWKDPALRAKVIASRWTPERRAEQALRLKRNLKEPKK